VGPGLPPFVIGHLGNTLEALGLVLSSGADGVEFDVRRCADGALVLHHDAGIEGLGPVSRLPGDRLPASVPRLEEALEACGDLIVNIEVKNLPVDDDWDPSEQVAIDVARLVSRRRLQENVIVSSFTRSALDAVRATDPAIRTGVLTLPDWDQLALLEGAFAKAHSALHPHKRAVSPELVDLVHSKQMWIVPWAVDLREEIVSTAAGGVDALITDAPDLAVEILGRRPRTRDDHPARFPRPITKR
jgi:glycerophosphoryl diester phosphodiesterase